MQLKLMHQAEFSSTVAVVAVHPDGDFIACGTNDGAFHVLEADGSTVIWSARHGSRWRKPVAVSSISISARGDMICTGAFDGSAAIWSALDGHCIGRVARFSPTPLYSNTFSPDGATLAMAYREGLIVVWDVAKRIETHRVRHVAWVTGIEFNPAGSLLGSVGFDQTIHAWRTVDFSEIWQLRTVGYASAISFAPEGDRLVVDGFDNRALLLSVVDGHEVGVLRHSASVCFARFSPRGREIVTGAKNNVMTIWSADSLEVLASMKFEELPGDPHMLPSGDAVVVGIGSSLRTFSLV